MQQHHSQSHRPAAAAEDQPQSQPQHGQRRQRRPAATLDAGAVGTTVAALALLALALLLAPQPASAFLAPSPSMGRRAAAPPPVPVRVMVRMMAAGEGGGEGAAPKGFGKKSDKKKAAAEPVAAPAAAAEEGGASGGGPAPMTTEEGLAKLNARQKMAYWEVQKEMEREMDLAEIEEYKETQRLLDEGVVGYLPEKISNRMLKRLIPFVSMPLLGAGGMFGFYLYLAKSTDIDVPPAFVAFTTQVPFLGALVGITYSIMSTSWDPDVEGSFWGGAEFKANVLNLLESLQKSKREERAKEKLKKYEATPAPNRAKRRELDRLTK